MTGIDDAIAARANDLHRHAGNGQFLESILIAVYHLLGGHNLLSHLFFVVVFEFRVNGGRCHNGECQAEQ